MKKILISLLSIFIITGAAFAAGTAIEAKAFFNNYINAANSYNPSLLSMYASNAKIYREVIKPNGQLVDVPFTAQQYKSQLKISQTVAKMRKYKNSYSNIKVTQVSNGFKITAKRKPSLSDYKLGVTMVVQKQPNGKWLIVEETMQTKEQVFLKYAK